MNPDNTDPTTVGDTRDPIPPTFPQVGDLGSVRGQVVLVTAVHGPTALVPRIEATTRNGLPVAIAHGDLFRPTPEQVQWWHDSAPEPGATFTAEEAELLDCPLPDAHVLHAGDASTGELVMLGAVPADEVPFDPVAAEEEREGYFYRNHLTPQQRADNAEKRDEMRYQRLLTAVAKNEVGERALEDARQQGLLEGRREAAMMLLPPPTSTLRERLGAAWSILRGKVKGEDPFA
jgi:hypothetical protein